MFPNSKPDIAPLRILASEIFAVLDVVQGRAVKIGAAAHEQRHRLRDRLQGFTARFAGRQLRVLGKFRNLR